METASTHTYIVCTRSQAELQQLHKRLAATPKGKDAAARVAVLEHELKAALQEGDRVRGMAQQAETALLENRRLGEDNAVLAARVKQVGVCVHRWCWLTLWPQLQYICMWSRLPLAAAHIDLHTKPTTQLQVDLQELTDAGVLGHNNPKQKIQYHLRLKQELEELRNECTVLLRERLHLEQCIRYDMATIFFGPVFDNRAMRMRWVPCHHTHTQLLVCPCQPPWRPCSSRSGRGPSLHPSQHACQVGHVCDPHGPPQRRAGRPWPCGPRGAAGHGLPTKG